MTCLIGFLLGNCKGCHVFLRSNTKRVIAMSGTKSTDAVQDRMISHKELSIKINEYLIKVVMAISILLMIRFWYSLLFNISTKY